MGHNFRDTLLIFKDFEMYILGVWSRLKGLTGISFMLLSFIKKKVPVVDHGYMKEAIFVS